jgi:hypothetical protein
LQWQQVFLLLVVVGYIYTNILVVHVAFSHVGVIVTNSCVSTFITNGQDTIDVKTVDHVSRLLMPVGCVVHVNVHSLKSGHQTMGETVSIATVTQA